MRYLLALAILLFPACSSDPTGCGDSTTGDLSAWTATYNAPSGPRAVGVCGYATLGPLTKDTPSYFGLRRSIPAGSIATLSARFSTNCASAKVAIAILEGGELEPGLPVIKDVYAGTPITVSVARPSPSGMVDYVVDAGGDDCSVTVGGVVARP